MNNMESKKEEGVLVLPWSSSILKAFKQYLHLLNPLTNKKMTPAEIDVLACLLFVDFKYREYPEEIRNSILFSKETRKKIIKYLKISPYSLNNVFSSLYKKEYLLKGKLKARIPVKNNQIKVKFEITLIDDPKENLLGVLATTTNDKEVDQTV